MIIAAVTAMLLTGGGFGYDLFGKDAQKLIVSVLEDVEQEKQVRSWMKAGAKQSKKASKELAKIFEAWLKEDLDPSTGWTEFDARLAEAQGVRSEAQSALIDVVFKIKDIVTAEQWEAAFAEALGDDPEPRSGNRPD